MLEPLLHDDADRAATAPQPDDEVRPETAFVDDGRQAERIDQQFVGLDVLFVRRRDAHSFLAGDVDLR